MASEKVTKTTMVDAFEILRDISRVATQRNTTQQQTPHFELDAMLTYALETSEELDSLRSTLEHSLGEEFRYLESRLISLISPAIAHLDEATLSYVTFSLVDNFIVLYVPLWEN